MAVLVRLLYHSVAAIAIASDVLEEIQEESIVDGRFTLIKDTVCGLDVSQPQKRT